MQVDPVNPAARPYQSTDVPENKAFTILRIKRKRNEEPLDALVVESRVRRKKSRRGIGVFQYAQTVEEKDWNDANRQKDIQEKISRLAREDAVKLESKGPVLPIDDLPPSPISRVAKEETSRRYTIVDREEPKPPTRRYPIAPPKVLSAKELENNKRSADFKMYDAVPANEQPMVLDEASEMDKFLPLLNDYLKLHDEGRDADVKQTGGLNQPKSSSDDDYVWDVFYHRPVTLSKWNVVANVGTVTGLPPSFGDGYDSTSDSDEELDEADEDSNAEEYYKNDYPEEENSDEFHESSDHDEVVNYFEDGEDQSDDF